MGLSLRRFCGRRLSRLYGCNFQKCSKVCLKVLKSLKNISMNNPVDQYQYSYGSGLVNPYGTLESSVREDYYTTCRVVDGVPADVGRADVLEWGPVEGLVLSADVRRLCVGVVAWPGVSLVLGSDFEDEGVNEYGAQEYRWYWDGDHPDSFIAVQLLQEERLGDGRIRYCIVMDICNGSPLLKGGSFELGVTTGLVTEQAVVAIQQTWMF